MKKAVLVAVLAVGSPVVDAAERRAGPTSQPSERELRLAARRDSKLNEEVAAVFRSADTTYLVGDVGRAAEGFAKVLSMAPASNYVLRAHARLGDCSYELKNYDTGANHYRRAAQMVEKGLAEEEKQAGIRADYMVGQSYLAAKNYTACFGAFRRFIDRNPGHPLVNLAYQSIGDAHLATEQHQQALTAYRMVGTTMEKKTASHKRVTPGQRLYLRVDDADVNVGEVPRSVTAVVKTSSGDVEKVELEPLGHRSPLFLATIPTILGEPRKSEKLDEAFAEKSAVEIRQLLADAQKITVLSKQLEQEAAEVERSVERQTNPAKVEKRRAELAAEVEQLQAKAKGNVEAACKRIDGGFTALEAVVEQWAPQRGVKALKGRTVATTQAAAEGADVKSALARPLESAGDEEAAMGPTTRPGVRRGLSENEIDRVRIDVSNGRTTPENIDARLTAISVWARLLKRQFQRIEVSGGDAITVEYFDEIGPGGPNERSKAIRKDQVEIASDGDVAFMTRDGAERVSQIVLGGEVMIRVVDPDRDVSAGRDKVEVMLVALPKVDVRASELRNEVRPATRPTTQRATPGEIVQSEEEKRAAEKLPLVPVGMPSMKVTLTETGERTGVFEALVKTTAKGIEGLPLVAEGQLRVGYEDLKAVRNPDQWVLASVVDCIADAGGEALAVKFGQSYLDQQAKLKRAVAAGEIGKIYLDLGLAKRGKAYLASAQADCNEVARFAAKTPLGEEALYHSWRIYFYAGLLDEAVGAARTLMAAYPLSDYVDDALFAIGQASLAQGEKEVEEAKAMGKSAGQNRNLSRAVSQFEDLVRRYPRSTMAAEALFLVGRAKIVAGQTGLDVFERLAKQYPDSVFAARGLARAAEYYVGIGDFRRAQEYYGRILIDYPDSPQLGDVTLNRGICQYKLGQMPEALASFYKVAEEHPGTELSKQAQKFINFINQKRGENDAKE